MKELNELVELAKAAVMDSRRSGRLAFQGRVEPETLLSIAEAFRALEQGKADAETVAENWKQETKIRNSQLDLAVEQRNQYQERAEAAEAKLAELENQEPAFLLNVDSRDSEQYQFDIRVKLSDGIHELFTRPAPAVSLAELVPDELTFTQA